VLLQGKVTAEELDEYKRFILTLAEKVAHAHREHGQGEAAVSASEQAATVAITEALG
jgi:flagellar biosynthesis chaperone FliJ